MSVTFSIVGERHSEEWEGNFVNLNQRNGADILSAIGLPGSLEEDLSGSLAAPVLGAFIRAALAAGAFNGTALPAHEGPGVMLGVRCDHVIDCGRVDGRLELRARQILKLTALAGARRIQWY